MIRSIFRENKRIFPRPLSNLVKFQIERRSNKGPNNFFEKTDFLKLRYFGNNFEFFVTSDATNYQ